MLSISEPIKGLDRLDYYLLATRTDYYTAGGERPGYWAGGLARRFGLEGDVDPEVVRRLYQGYSPDGAVRWWFAFDEAVHKLTDHPLDCGLAPESETLRFQLRQFLFKTRRGRRYRGVFVVIGDEVRVLRIRGPGQPPLERNELGDITTT